MELELLAAKYGRLLGGIDVEAALRSIRRNYSGEAIRRILGLEVSEVAAEDDLECKKARALLSYYKAELKRLKALRRELTGRGVSPSDLYIISERIKTARRLAGFYREILERCGSPQVSDISRQR
ncbi:MAG: hypothetical protein ABWJ97_08070 [Thermoproteus sp.]